MSTEITMQDLELETVIYRLNLLAKIKIYLV